MLEIEIQFMITITKCGNDLLSEISIWSIYLKCARLYKMTTTPIFEFSRIIPIYYIYKFRTLSPSGGEMAPRLDMRAAAIYN